MKKIWLKSTDKALALLKELPLYPITSDNPLHQTLDSEDKALELYARKHMIDGIFYLGDDGKRYVIGPDINYFSEKDYSDQPWHYSFHLLRTTRHARRRAYIDRPKPAEDRAIVTHCSEQGWNVPVDDPRHLMALPAEILRNILELCLTVSRPLSLQPNMTTSGSTAYFQKKNHTIITPSPFNNGGSRKDKPFVRVARQDDYGPYTELRRLYRAAIDATCLRACKKLNNIGSELLYGRNEFFVDLDTVCCPSYILDHNAMTGYQQRPYKPFPENDPEIRQRIKEIQSGVQLRDPYHWISSASFLRFLLTIGPTNTSMIRSLQFSGRFKLHECSEFTCNYDDCTDGLIECLRYYLPFVIACCPNVQKVTLYADEDYSFDGTPADVAQNRDKVLAPFLEENMPKIPGLINLDVFDGLETMQRLACAEPARKLLKDRASQQAKAVFETRSVQQESAVATLSGMSEPSEDSEVEEPIINTQDETSALRRLWRRSNFGLLP
ncbi:hypothetical protein ONS95_001890 [Cadophora gregata]|uniref:uncharacterized protein n=1 Tax=Cadophora gregata TaxID=51156 RepID=UPI0026DD11AE|nr:uncharacterized protein ONS95_001890 [Cadophora gregata]KAK0111536.1 hypothetical protein ONS95_001890 [Cadophora gregata]KAK0111987.1 hypothetical protein ONS96_001249 [Cadophora gregata f. sp. sojae]